MGVVKGDKGKQAGDRQQHLPKNSQNYNKKTAVDNPLAKRGNYEKYPPMTKATNRRPPVPAGPLFLATVATMVAAGQGVLRTVEKIVELEEEKDKLRWHIIGLSEVRREGEDRDYPVPVIEQIADCQLIEVILESGNLLYYREGDHLSQGGVIFMVHKSLVNNAVKIESVSTRVAYLILRITKRYSLKVKQVYAPTSAHPDEEVEENV